MNIKSFNMDVISLTSAPLGTSRGQAQPMPGQTPGQNLDMSMHDVDESQFSMQSSVRPRDSFFYQSQMGEEASFLGSDTSLGVSVVRRRAD